METTLSKVNLAADVYNRYPGEVVTIFIRFLLPQIEGCKLQISMPRSLKIESYELPAEIPVSLLVVSEIEQELIVLLPLDKYFEVGKEYELSIQTRIHAFYFDHYLEVDATLLDANLDEISSESIQIAVLGKAKYLEFLPELYGTDDFTSRFLMMLESFWKPIKQQIDQVENYFDPSLSPIEFIPWLCTWVGLPVDNDLPPSRMRTLLKSSMYFYQCRGTVHALKSLLEIYTAGSVSIVEQRAKNFVLGSEAKLGPTLAIGKGNKPDSVHVKLHVPISELQRMNYSEEMYEKKITGIIQDLIPAHSMLYVKCFFTNEPI